MSSSVLAYSWFLTLPFSLELSRSLTFQYLLKWTPSADLTICLNVVSEISEKTCFPNPHFYFNLGSYPSSIMCRWNFTQPISGWEMALEGEWHFLSHWRFPSSLRNTRSTIWGLHPPRFFIMAFIVFLWLFFCNWNFKSSMVALQKALLSSIICFNKKGSKT